MNEYERIYWRGVVFAMALGVVLGYWLATLCAAGGLFPS